MTAESSSLTGPVTDETRGARGFQFSRLVRASGYVAVLLALGSAAGTFLILLGLTPIAPTPDVVFKAMLVNGALVAFLVLVIAWVVGSLAVARSRGQAGASLHIRIVGLFSLVAVLPAALLAVTASITLDRGLDNWFSTRTRNDRRQFAVAGPGLRRAAGRSAARRYPRRQARTRAGEFAAQGRPGAFRRVSRFVGLRP